MTQTAARPPMLTMAQALDALMAGVRPITDSETVDTLQANGRVLAAGVTSALRVPPADNTSMDGYVMRAADVPAPGTRLPVSQRIPAGHVGTELAPGTAARIFTGGLIPPGADAVVMQEQCQADGDAVIVNHVPASGEWIRRAGEDIEAGSEILPAG
ncbi:MAG: molybdopterin molybdenumtransferase MoeA, partial [Burkholderiaceae bacterium]